MLNYLGEALAPSLRGINTTFAPPSDPFLYGCMTGAFSISGRVTDEFDQPVTDVVFVVGYGSSNTEISAASIVNPLMNAAGYYTIPNLITGTYTFMPVKLEDLNSPPPASAKTSSYTVIPASFAIPQTSRSSSAYDDCKRLLRALSKSEGRDLDPDIECPKPIPSTRQRTVPTSSPGNDFTIPNPYVPTPPNTGLKGANWLRFVDPDDPVGTGTNYQERNIGWNLESAGNIDIDSSWYEHLDEPFDSGDNRVGNLGQEIFNFRNGGENVSTIIRLQTPPPPDPALLPFNIQWDEDLFLGGDGLLTDDFTQELRQELDELGILLSAHNDLSITAPVADTLWRIVDNTGSERTYIVGRSGEIISVYDSPYYYGDDYDRHNKGKTCEELNGWMDTLDAEVDSIINGRIERLGGRDEKS